MSVTVTWATKVINVPKSYLTLIQAAPTEIYEMNLNQFHLTLKELEATEEGQVFVDTHRHNTEVELGGITYARVIEIINGYTVTFEDDQYAVNLVGANSNVGDVVNVNQVSVRSYNAAGLISNAAIEFASFNGGVTWDPSGSNTGTAFPAGTLQEPCSLLSDVMLIAGVRGFDKVFVLTNGTIDAGGNYTKMVWIGESISKTTITIDSDAIVPSCEFYEATITGTLDGNAKLQNCRVLDLNYIYGIIEECMLGPGTIVLGGGNEAHFLDCWSGVVGADTPVIDCGGSGQAVALRNYNGGVKLINKTGSDKASIDLNSGHLILDSTVTAGEIVVRGVGRLTDNSTGTVTVDSSGLITASKVMGIGGENVKWSNIAYDANHNMTAATITSYTDETLTVAKHSWRVMATYDIDGEILTYQMVQI